VPEVQERAVARPKADADTTPDLPPVRARLEAETGDAHDVPEVQEPVVADAERDSGSKEAYLTVQQTEGPALSALGVIVTSYSRLEWLVSAFIGRLLNPDGRVGHTITAGMPISQKLTLLSNLFLLVAKEEPATTDVDAMERAVAKADRAVELRNAVMHTMSWTTDEAGVVHRLKPVARRGRGLEWKAERASGEDLLRVAKELGGAFDAVSDLMAAHFEGATGQKGDWEPPTGKGTLWGIAVRYSDKRNREGK
jgi:hypothetical protein